MIYILPLSGPVEKAAITGAVTPENKLLMLVVADVA